MSYNILKQDEELIEGISLINLKYPNYNPEKLFDDKKKEYYSLEMIMNSLEGIKNLKQDFIKVIFFDYIIGNTDRHQNNWGVIKKNEDIIKLAPVYDNGSSLCSYVTEDKIEEFLGKDKNKFYSLVNTKSRSRIRIDKYEKKEPTHLEVMKYLKENMREEFDKNLLIINKKINEENINLILNKTEKISKQREILIRKYIFEKKKLINNI